MTIGINLIERIGIWYSKKSRKFRGKIFLNRLQPRIADKILDLGSGTGYHFFQFIKPSKNVFISDFNSELLEYGKKMFGYNTIVLDANKKLPFKDNFFDIIFCSSLIEHVTGDKRKVLTLLDNAEFRQYAYPYQKQLAKEIRRVSKSYYIQTPYKFFPIESHTWLPAILVMLPRSVQLRIILFTNKYWVKKTYPDWNLLTINQMKELFPDAEIILERSFGFVKSIIALKKDNLN